MREIKFRGKTREKVGDKKIWIYGDLLQGCQLCDIYEISDCNSIDGSRYEVDKETVGQYIGLKDKNGTEIYEGDIVYVVSEDEKAFILWEGETAKYTIQFNGWCADFDVYYGRELEVIGNIYDNPELLKAGD